MAPHITDRVEPAVVPASPPLARTRRLDWRLKLAVLVVVSSSLQLVLRQNASSFLGSELGSITRAEKEDWEPLAHLAYQIGQLTFGWYLSYDVIDISALTLLANAPFTYLIVTYYGISPLTASLSLGIQIVSIALPTYLLRPFAEYHSAKSRLPNRFLLDSFQVQSSTALLALSTYVFSLFAAQKLNLNTFLVYHFDNIKTLEAAHSENVLSLVAKTLLVGWAAQGFLLNSALGQSGVATPKEFDPATSTLTDTIHHNVWYFSRRTRELIKRTAVVAGVTFIHTLWKVQTIQGTDSSGAAGYAGIWVAATALIGLVFTWVSDA